ncbi:hypothetical protein DAI22_09g046300 [Oryza sativa Japonica Group]|nr:hypothetical protein DAI22_09g046300 [Oryza sativa Japonica Group]
MSPALPPFLHGSELQSPPTVSSCSLLILLLQNWYTRGARTQQNPFTISRFGFGVKYFGFLHLDW